MQDEKFTLHDCPWYESHNREQTQEEGNQVLRSTEEICELLGKRSVCNVTKSMPSQNKGECRIWGTTDDSPIDWFQ
jgi:hypothetical protein